MAACHLIENDGKRVTITLKPALRFHDGEPVRANDAVVSLKRWMQRLWPSGWFALVDEVLALGIYTRLLWKPFPLQIHGLGAIDWPCIRHARADRPHGCSKADRRSNWQLAPFKFKKDEKDNSGSLIVYERNPAYVPVPPGRHV